jgi:hypothetical protein
MSLLIAVTDDAYERMMHKLLAGAPYVKTYMGVCPHKTEKKCRCPFAKNVLLTQDGKHSIVRDMPDGTRKEILPLSRAIAKEGNH